MTSLISNAGYKSFSMIRASGLLSPTFGSARQFSRVLTGADWKFCQYCRETILISRTEYNKVLLSGDLYEELPILARGCRAIKEDTFSENENCLVYQVIRNITSHILLNCPPTNLERYDHKSSEVSLSRFLKFKGLAENESDLTGDGGKLALEMLASHRLISKFGCVVDVGGQDSQFVQNFPGAQQKIVDINKLAPFDEKILSIKFAIGSADIIFRDSSYIPEATRPRALFALSSFINVLSPSDAWNNLEIIIQRMNEGDYLIITNLDLEQFSGKKEKYSQEKEDNGIIPFNKIIKGVKSEERYKSTIGLEFKNILIKKFPGLGIQDEKRSSLKCNLLNDGKLLKPEVKFITVMFKLVK